MGFVVAVVTGVLLFTADATAVWNNPVFAYKLALIALGLVNITVFHFGVWRSAKHWPADAPAVASRGGSGGIDRRLGGHRLPGTADRLFLIH